MLSTLVVLFALVAVTNSGPLHASCEINWSFSVPCSEVKNKIVQQIKDWNGLTDCGSGEKCGYSLVSETNTEVKGKHETPKSHYLDDLTFTLTGSDSCKVEAYSTSETWYALLDYGTNYCNLRNLIDGSGLSQTAGFKEETSDSVCTQYSSRNCDKY